MAANAAPARVGKSTGLGCVRMKMRPKAAQSGLEWLSEDKKARDDHHF